MKSIIRKLLKTKCVKMILAWKQLIEWHLNGKKPPVPHSVKCKTINSLQGKYDLKVLVETGTYLGDMVEAQKKYFDKIISIELDKKLAQKAVEKFANQKNIEIIQGDSGKILNEVMPTLGSAAIFWLDGHYSAGITAKGELNTPIMKELQPILSSSFPHVVLIDDARLFVGKDDYPTVAEIEDMIKISGRDLQLSIYNDIIILAPQKINKL